MENEEKFVINITKVVVLKHTKDSKTFLNPSFGVLIEKAYPLEGLIKTNFVECSSQVFEELGGLDIIEFLNGRRQIEIIEDIISRGFFIFMEKSYKILSFDGIQETVRIKDKEYKIIEV